MRPYEACALDDAGVPAENVNELLEALRICAAVTDHDPAGDLPSRMPSAIRRHLRGELAALVRRHGTLAGETLSQRTRKRVVLYGDPRFVGPLASALAASGVHRLWIHATGQARLFEAMPAGLRSDDEGRPRGTALADAVWAVAPEADLRPFPGWTVPDLAIIAGPVGAATAPNRCWCAGLAPNSRSALATAWPWSAR